MLSRFGIGRSPVKEVDIRTKTEITWRFTHPQHNLRKKKVQFCMRKHVRMKVLKKTSRLWFVNPKFFIIIMKTMISATEKPQKSWTFPSVLCTNMSHRGY